MKKLFTLALLALLTVGAQAQRKTWDFTKGFKQTTIDNLKAAGWTDQTVGKIIQSAKRSAAGPLTYTIDGAEWTCPETEGLTFGAVSANHLNVAYGVDGDKYIWLNGKKAEDCVTIPSIPAGEKVTIVYASHSSSEARGFKCSTSGFSDADGATSFTTKEQATVVLTNNTGNESDLKISATNGFHIYSIVIGEGDPEVTNNVAYLYTGEQDAFIAALQARENTTVTPIDVASTTVTAEELQKYSLVVLSASIPADNAAVAVVKQALPYTPILNMNANLYAAWTYGTAVALETPVGVIKDATHSLLKGVEATTEGEGDEAISFVELGEGAMGVTLGEYFEGDATPLKDMSDQNVVAHLHNINHNGYIYFPYGASEASTKILSNAVEMLIESKNEVTQAPEPGIILEYKDHNTNITMTAAKSLVKPHIYYTIDGSEPTENSTEYTGVINTTEPITVKAAVIAEGYLLSKVNTMEVAIKEQPKTPVINMAYEDGKTIVTIDSGSDAEGLVVYYNMTGSTKINASDVYMDAITVTKPTDIYAFVVAAESVWSEVAHERAVVKNARVAVDVLSHFYAPANWIKQTDGETVLTNNGNMFAAGTNDNFSMWNKESSHTETDPETGDEITVYDQEIDWVTSDEPLEEPQWMVMTKGQGVLWQNNDPKTDVIGDNDGIYPVSSLDIDTIFVATKNNICFYKFAAGERPTAVIQSKNKYAGPFDIVMIDNMGSGNLMMEVSADGDNWTQVGDTIAKSGFSRLWQKDVAVYDGTDEVYVRVSQPDVNTGTPKIYDIYIANNGEKSKELKAQFDQEWEAATGIETIEKQGSKGVKAVYNLNGIRQNGLQRGLNIVVMGDGSVKKVVVK